MQIIITGLLLVVCLKTRNIHKHIPKERKTYGIFMRCNPHIDAGNGSADSGNGLFAEEDS